MPHSAASARRRSAPQARPRSRSVRPIRARPGTIRWDRVGRVGLLLVLGVILLLYAAPLKHWIEQKQTAAEHAAELRRLEAEHVRLQRRARELTRADAIEREARRLGMVRRGERAYVVEDLPR